MDVLEGLESLTDQTRGCVLTVGNFEGVHMGHQRILQNARRLANVAGARTVVMTFEPTPAALLIQDRRPELILPRELKFRLLGQCGADLVLLVKTSRDFLATEPQAFVRDVLIGRIGPRHIVEGPNFFFGRERAGSVETLRQLAAEGQYELTVVDPVTMELPGEGEVRVSSSLIRRLVRDGDVASAAKCLGRPFALYGRVVGGARRGRLLDFPTANLEPPVTVIPGNGVYAGWAETGAARYASAVSVGTRPTFGPSSERAIEVHLLDASGDYYDQSMTVSFVARLRDQRKFPDAETLRAQIVKDVQRVREICR